MLGLEPEGGYLAPMMVDLAKTYPSQGKYSEAEELSSDILQIHLGSLPAENLRRLEITGWLAIGYWKPGKWHKAEEWDF